jgi:hypothetical protein
MVPSRNVNQTSLNLKTGTIILEIKTKLLSIQHYLPPPTTIQTGLGKLLKNYCHADTRMREICVGRGNVLLYNQHIETEKAAQPEGRSPLLCGLCERTLFCSPAPWVFLFECLLFGHRRALSEKAATNSEKFFWTVEI